MRCTILSYNIHGLPWSRDNSKHICNWFISIKPEIICLQEAFRPSIRQYFQEQLVRHGYRVCIPRDEGIAYMNSGLLTAVRESEYTVVSDCFSPYHDVHNLEYAANKGFHAVRLQHRKSRRRITIINTHTQSDTEVSWLFGKTVHHTRRAQFQQILDFIQYDRYPVLLAGDLNTEYSPHPYVRFLQHADPIKKGTFYATGEDLDHIAWFPTHWARLLGTVGNAECAFCNIDATGPRMEACSVLQKPWSDHAPLLVTVYVPPIKPVI